MSDVLLTYRGRQIRQADVLFLRELIAQNPDLSRRALSAKVCQAWNDFSFRHYDCIFKLIIYTPLAPLKRGI